MMRPVDAAAASALEMLFEGHATNDGLLIANALRSLGFWDDMAALTTPAHPKLRRVTTGAAND